MKENIENGKKLLQKFEHMKDIAEAKVLSKASLERPLTAKEFERFQEVMNRIRG